MKKIITVMLLAAVLLTSCGAPSGDTPTSSAQNSASTPSPASEPEPTPEPTPEPRRKTGDTVTLGDWEITLLGYEATDKVASSQYTAFKADEGNQYVVVTLTVKNTGTTAGTFLPSFSMGDDVRAKLVYQDAYEFSATNLLGHSDELHDKGLNPLSTAEGMIAFEVAEEAAISDELVLVLSQGKESVEYDLCTE